MCRDSLIRPRSRPRSDLYRAPGNHQLTRAKGSSFSWGVPYRAPPSLLCNGFFCEGPTVGDLCLDANSESAGVKT